MRTCGMERRPYISTTRNFCTKLLHFQNLHHHIAFIFLHHIFLSFFIVSILMASSSSKSVVAATAPKDPSTAVLIRVDQSGQGDYKTIQAAIDSVPADNNEFVFIWVKPGTYREKIIVPADKPYITLSGTQASNTIITWNEGDHIYDSPTVSILAPHFVGRYLTFENTYGTKGKGVALRVSGDKAAFYSCRMIGFQDTLFDDMGGHYYSNCYIEGATDFIFGNAASLYEKCHIHSINHIGYATITAQKRESPLENTGFVFLGCKITGVRAEAALLGRPWGAYSRVVFTYTFISSTIAAQGWDNWGDVKKESTVLYGEYKCYGAGAKRAGRVGWSKDLTTAEVAPFLSKDMIGGRGWLRPAPTKFTKGFAK